MDETQALPTDPRPERPVGRGLKVPHLVVGLLLLGVAGMWALVRSDVLAAGHLTQVGAGLLILAGVVGLVAALAAGRGPRQ